MIACVEGIKADVLTSLHDSIAYTDVAYLFAVSKDFEYPMFAKALAGGGGRSMRFIENEKEFKERVAEASREAEAAFGDGRVYLETAVIMPQHIEVQILADG